MPAVFARARVCVRACACMWWADALGCGFLARVAACAVIAIGFNVESVSYKNLKFQGVCAA